MLLAWFGHILIVANLLQVLVKGDLLATSGSQQVLASGIRNSLQENGNDEIRHRKSSADGIEEQIQKTIAKDTLKDLLMEFVELADSDVRKRKSEDLANPNDASVLSLAERPVNNPQEIRISSPRVIKQPGGPESLASTTSAAGFHLLKAAGSHACSDTEGWVDALGYSCEDYSARSLCTFDKNYGSGWNSQWGTFGLYSVGGVDATEACCNCGKADGFLTSSSDFEMMMVHSAHTPKAESGPPTPAQIIPKLKDQLLKLGLSLKDFEEIARQIAKDVADQDKPADAVLPLLQEPFSTETYYPPRPPTLHPTSLQIELGLLPLLSSSTTKQGTNLKLANDANQLGAAIIPPELLFTLGFPDFNFNVTFDLLISTPTACQGGGFLFTYATDSEYTNDCGLGTFAMVSHQDWNMQSGVYLMSNGVVLSNSKFSPRSFYNRKTTVTIEFKSGTKEAISISIYFNGYKQFKHQCSSIGDPLHHYGQMEFAAVTGDCEQSFEISNLFLSTNKDLSAEDRSEIDLFVVKENMPLVKLTQLDNYWENILGSTISWSRPIDLHLLHTLIMLRPPSDFISPLHLMTPLDSLGSSSENTEGVAADIAEVLEVLGLSASETKLIAEEIEQKFEAHNPSPAENENLSEKIKEDFAVFTQASNGQTINVEGVNSDDRLREVVKAKLLVMQGQYWKQLNDIKSTLQQERETRQAEQPPVIQVNKVQTPKLAVASSIAELSELFTVTSNGAKTVNPSQVTNPAGGVSSASLLLAERQRAAGVPPAPAAIVTPALVPAAIAPNGLGIRPLASQGEPLQAAAALQVAATPQLPTSNTARSSIYGTRERASAESPKPEAAPVGLLPEMFVVEQTATLASSLETLNMLREELTAQQEVLKQQNAAIAKLLNGGVQEAKTRAPKVVDGIPTPKPTPLPTQPKTIHLRTPKLDEPCFDIDGWADVIGYTCGDYANYEFCTPEKGYGPGWGTQRKSFDVYARFGIDATVGCCVCGRSFLDGDLQEQTAASFKEATEAQKLSFALDFLAQQQAKVEEQELQVQLQERDVAAQQQQQQQLQIAQMRLGTGTEGVGVMGAQALPAAAAVAGGTVPKKLIVKKRPSPAPVPATAAPAVSLPVPALHSKAVLKKQALAEELELNTEMMQADEIPEENAADKETDAEQKVGPLSEIMMSRFLSSFQIDLSKLELNADAQLSADKGQTVILSDSALQSGAVLFPNELAESFGFADYHFGVSFNLFVSIPEKNCAGGAFQFQMLRLNPSVDDYSSSYEGLGGGPGSFALVFSESEAVFVIDDKSIPITKFTGADFYNQTTSITIEYKHDKSGFKNLNQLHLFANDAEKFMYEFEASEEADLPLAEMGFMSTNGECKQRYTVSDLYVSTNKDDLQDVLIDKGDMIIRNTPEITDDVGLVPSWMKLTNSKTEALMGRFTSTVGIGMRHLQLKAGAHSTEPHSVILADSPSETGFASIPVELPIYFGYSDFHFGLTFDLSVTAPKGCDGGTFILRNWRSNGCDTNDDCAENSRGSFSISFARSSSTFTLDGAAVPIEKLSAMDFYDQTSAVTLEYKHEYSNNNLDQLHLYVNGVEKFMYQFESSLDKDPPLSQLEFVAISGDCDQKFIISSMFFSTNKEVARDEYLKFLSTFRPDSDKVTIAPATSDSEPEDQNAQGLPVAADSNELSTDIEPKTEDQKVEELALLSDFNELDTDIETITTCEDKDGWADVTGEPCESYVKFQWCTTTGEFGPNWTDGPFELFADEDGDGASQACCQCGGGIKTKVEVKRTEAPAPKAPLLLLRTHHGTNTAESKSNPTVEPPAESAISTSSTTDARSSITAELPADSAAATPSNADETPTKAATLPSLPAPPAPPSSSLSRCVDAPGWTDITGESCDSYLKNQWCTPTGGFGVNWSDGPFKIFANQNGMDATQACCNCGGGSLESGEAPASPEALPELAPPVLADLSAVTEQSTKSVKALAKQQRLAAKTEADITVPVLPPVANFAISPAKLDIGPTSCQDMSSWTDITGETCASYAKNNWCTPVGGFGLNWSDGPFSLFADKNGVDATQACCSCGGGILVSCADQPDWLDVTGESCASYVSNQWCTSTGGFGPSWTDGAFSLFADKNGIDATQACCGCGGGVAVTCTNQNKWADVSGETCGSYTANNWCTPTGAFGPGWSDGPFEAYADKNGVDATDACCNCGGGAVDIKPTVGQIEQKVLRFSSLAAKPLERVGIAPPAPPALPTSLATETIGKKSLAKKEAATASEKDTEATLFSALTVTPPQPPNGAVGKQALATVERSEDTPLLVSKEIVEDPKATTFSALTSIPPQPPADSIGKHALAKKESAGETPLVTYLDDDKDAEATMFSALSILPPQPPADVIGKHALAKKEATGDNLLFDSNEKDADPKETMFSAFSILPPQPPADPIGKHALAKKEVAADTLPTEDDPRATMFSSLAIRPPAPPASQGSLQASGTSAQIKSPLLNSESHLVNEEATLFSSFSIRPPQPPTDAGTTPKLTSLKLLGKSTPAVAISSTLTQSSPAVDIAPPVAPLLETPNSAVELHKHKGASKLLPQVETTLMKLNSMRGSTEPLMTSTVFSLGIILGLFGFLSSLVLVVWKSFLRVRRTASHYRYDEV